MNVPVMFLTFLMGAGGALAAPSQDYDRSVPSSYKKDFLDPDVFEGGRFRALSAATIRLVWQAPGEKAEPECSAFFIDALRGYALTAWHCFPSVWRPTDAGLRVKGVVETYSKNKVLRSDIGPVVFRDDLGRDVAVVRFAGVNSATVAELPAASAVLVKPGDTLYSTGYDGLFDVETLIKAKDAFQKNPRLLTKGTVLGDAGELPFVRAPGNLVVKMRLIGGHSGGPVFDDQGRSVGVAVAHSYSWERLSEDPAYRCGSACDGKKELEEMQAYMKKLGLREDELESLAVVVPIGAIAARLKAAIADDSGPPLFSEPPKVPKTPEEMKALAPFPD